MKPTMIPAEEFDSIDENGVVISMGFRCRCCREPISIPLRHDCSNPIYVMWLEKEQAMLQKEYQVLHEHFTELARECVDAGVRPAFMRRADEMREKLNQLLNRFKRADDRKTE
jgi:hypothetical protein